MQLLLIVGLTLTVAIVESADTDLQCCMWAFQGECSTNPVYMRVHCHATCGTTGATEVTAENFEDNIIPKCKRPEGLPISPVAGKDSDPNCEKWSGDGECRKNPYYMNAACPKSCNATGNPYLSCGDTDSPAEEGCANADKECEMWAWEGECANNAVYMGDGCCLACRRLETVLLKNCPKPTED